jgi:hypothetical protein
MIPKRPREPNPDGPEVVRAAVPGRRGGGPGSKRIRPRGTAPDWNDPNFIIEFELKIHVIESIASRLSAGAG